MLGCPPLSLPSPTRWKFITHKLHSGVSCHQCACTLAHRIIHRAEFFPTATCQRHRHRQLALGLARKLERLGGLFVVLPERGHWFFHLLLRPLLPWVRMHVCVMFLSARCVSGYVCVFKKTDGKQLVIHTIIHMYIGLHPSSHFPGRRVACGEDVRLLFITVGPSTKGVC